MRDDTEPRETIAADSILVVAGQAAGSVIPIPPTELLLGREADQAGRLGDDPMLSRRHARITRDGEGRLILEDLASTNGTFLNGTRLAAPQQLRAGDVIDVGGSKLQVRTAAPAHATQVAVAPVPAPEPPPPSPDSGEWSGIELGDEATYDAIVLPPPGPPPAPAPVAPVAAAAGRPRQAPQAAPRQGHATVEGQVRGIQQRTESYGESGSQMIWTFRLERYDQAGNRLPPIPVQMRGIAFDGALGEGDEVRVIGRWKDGTLHSERVQNLTTNATVKKKSFKTALIVFLIIVAVMVIGFITIVRISDNNFQEGLDRSHQEFCDEATAQAGVTPPGC